jgi:NAD(P)-dependent dehydrogenase (short-subunit alcohol dehydrogenase family)
MNMDLKETVIAITAAAPGYGKKTAKVLSAEGADLALMDVDAADLKKTVDCFKPGVKVKSFGAEAAQHMIESRAAGRAQSAMKEEGLSPSAVAEAARHLAEGIRQGAQGAIKQATMGTGPQ